MKTLHTLFLLLSFSLFIACDKDEDKIQPEACFTYEIDYSSNLGYRIQFTNCSKYATSYLWNFGDGNTSTDENPEHNYNIYPTRNIVQLTAINEHGQNTLIDTIIDWNIVEKPNIYLYPEIETEISLSLVFPKGGKVVKSEPKYNTGWSFTVTPEGKIDNTYDFLFYESVQPSIWQKQQGWSIAKENLHQFFTKNMKQYGFNPNEITDFVDYWIPLLQDANYYTIFPQTKEVIDNVILLDLSVNSDNINRLFYVIQKNDKPSILEEPQIVPFLKAGFYINEWGVLRK